MNSGLESFHKTVDQAEPGDQLGVLLRGLGPKDVRRGTVLVPQGHNHKATDKAKAQVKSRVYYSHVLGNPIYIKQT